MAIIDVKFFSSVLCRNESFSVIIPWNADIKTSRVIYLLHGFCGDNRDWVEAGHANEIAEKYGVCFVMPNANNSFYLNQDNGPKYFEYISKEVLNEAIRLFGFGNNLYIAGLSMGGYGALAIGLSDLRYKAIGTFSGVVLIEKKVGALNQPFMKAIKDSIKEENTINYLINKRKEKVNYIFQYCGSNDGLYNMNKEFSKKLEDISNHFTFKTDNRGHEWQAWRDCLNWFLEEITKNNY